MFYQEQVDSCSAGWRFCCCSFVLSKSQQLRRFTERLWRVSDNLPSRVSEAALKQNLVTLPDPLTILSRAILSASLLWFCGCWQEICFSFLRKCSSSRGHQSTVLWWTSCCSLRCAAAEICVLSLWPSDVKDHPLHFVQIALEGFPAPDVLWFDPFSTLIYRSHEWALPTSQQPERTLTFNTN